MFRKTVAKPKKIDTFFTPTKRTRVAKQTTKHNPNIIRLPELNEYITKKNNNPRVDTYGEYFFHRTDEEALEGILRDKHLKSQLGDFTKQLLPDVLNEDNIPPELQKRWRKYAREEFDFEELGEIVDEMETNYPEYYEKLISERIGVYAEIAPYAYGGDTEGWDVILVIDNRDHYLSEFAIIDNIDSDSIIIQKDIPLDRLSVITYDREDEKTTSIIPLKSRIGD